MLIDSNILIYSLNSASQKHQAAQTFLQLQKQLIFAQQNVFETLRILTHSKFPNPFPVDKAIDAVAEITDKATILTPTLETQDLATALTHKYQITGTEIFDAYLVATALSNNVKKIATDNVAHLGKYTEIKVVNPFDFFHTN